MADASARAAPRPDSTPGAPAGDSERSSSPSAVPRVLPTWTTSAPPPPASGSRGARRGPATAGSGGRGASRKTVPPASGSASGGRATDRLVEAVKMIGGDIDPAVAGADILQLAMEKGQMFEWMSFWPEQGYPKEDHRY